MRDQPPPREAERDKDDKDGCMFGRMVRQSYDIKEGGGKAHIGRMLSSPRPNLFVQRKVASSSLTGPARLAATSMESSRSLSGVGGVRGGSSHTGIE